jgi:hypothetical protein
VASGNIRRMRHPAGRPILAVLCLMGLAAGVGGCDKFFIVNGTLTQCGVMTAIPEAKITLSVDPGSLGSETEMFTTNTDGSFHASLNKPPETSATITFVRTGFVMVSNDFKGLPNSPYHMNFCMNPAQ